MDFNKVTEIIRKINDVKNEDNSTGFWIGIDGIFHDGEEPMKNVNEFLCHCNISYYEPTGGWIVTPWLYTMDIPCVFKTLENARKMAFLWLKWISYIYGDGMEEPIFEADWLEIKSNRSVVMMLFEQECERLKKEIYYEELNITKEENKIKEGKYIEK